MNKKSKREQHYLSIASGTQISRAAGWYTIDNPTVKSATRSGAHTRPPTFAQVSASFECDRNERLNIVYMPALCLNRSMTNEELSQQITALTTTVTEKFNEIDGRLDKLQAGQDDLVAKYDSLKAGQEDLVAKHADLQVGLDDLRTKYGELNEKQGHIVNAQKTIAKMQADLQHTVEEQGAKLEEDFTDMKATQASIQHDIARINRKIVVEAGVRDTMHESVFSTQDSHYRDLDRRLRLVEAHFPELGQQGA